MILVSVPNTTEPKPPAIPEPSELSASILAGAAVTGALTMLGLPAYPAIMLGAFVWATVFHKYRKRWVLPEAGSSAA